MPKDPDATRKRAIASHGTTVTVQSAWARFPKDAENDALLPWFLVQAALGEGKLEPLAHYIKQTRGKIEPAIAMRLAAMIEGDADFEIHTRKSRKLANRSFTLADRIEESRLVRRIATFIAERDGFRRGHRKRAFAEASEKFGMSVSWIKPRMTDDVRELAIRKVTALRNLQKPTLTDQS